MPKPISFFIIMVLLLSLTGTAAAAAGGEINVYVDGAKIKFTDQKPYINSDNRTLVPVRFVSEALGAKVDWMASTKTVKIEYDSKLIVLEIGLPKATVGTNVVALDTAPAITNSRTMVPLRFVSECLGAQVEWKAAESAVYITTAQRAKDEALIDSDLILDTPPPGDNQYNVNLSATIDYRFNRPIEPQIIDLKELLERRFSPEEVKPIIDYIRTKKIGDGSHLPEKGWTIGNKTLCVSDAIAGVTVTIWNH
jgi:hypothetical protein